MAFVCRVTRGTASISQVTGRNKEGLQLILQSGAQEQGCGNFLSASESLFQLLFGHSIHSLYLFNLSQAELNMVQSFGTPLVPFEDPDIMRYYFHWLPSLEHLIQVKQPRISPISLACRILLNRQMQFVDGPAW